MNDGRQMGVHYVDAGFPYAVNDNFVDFFQGFTHVPVNYAFAGSIPDQESVYWSMNMNPYKFGLSGPGSTSYYSSYEVNGHLPRMEIDRAEWEYPSTITTVEEPATTDSPPRRDGVTSMQTIPEECSPNHHESNSSSQVIWQDNIYPDDMTYEELLDLGEAVGTQSRGLSQELIDMLPTSKYKFGSLFKRKNSGKRCVICQMTYRRGDQQMKLPCSHVYHGECITKWLSINKKCPVCNTEVFGEESTH
ncbi:hypothetical protein GLYMA_13G203300v4 [Glycine max]|uniref:RING-type domain-containing protein n=3 Tax=Glycine subgen. Soja TaxID=1462606 RepID=I1M0Y6_SOYBN|nr:E3 ubiquitin-protein ligase BIG BROTHER [Glycine max]XP_028187654.1 E3 ubiquitin-protein ligase BIG BROTHER-like [Glycine soja]XP_040864179.1 E3 ubiquitin-protein ligase BIG BROTHER [Glycine max]KAG4960114.1 hypothetical protein JHK87_036747 [Glycine soja]KAG4977528.1 hypothetical protein JHK86_037002 [Glycine max]KAG5130806.1 hypothetical protein JHK84_037203 [Glycine max]KAH1102471.1 hypothetical protein GYH30_036823 [Glycine max]KAH1217570.1 E3 ubiquitin ligase BIG BROTHER [Glycine max|eukprot:XP_003542854.1 E3 ubiquitin-protein ligase BIG BROTHER [Glycine max]